MIELTARRLLPLVFVLFAAALGCSHHTDEEYMPAQEVSRKALEAALTAWQNGQEPGTIDGETPVEVADSKWKSGQKLSKFEILSEEPGDGPKVFSVRLTLKQPASQQTVRYVVVGRKPIWVYREEDYKGSAGM
jgi:hypothetical protein